MAAARFAVLALIVIVLGGCVGAGPAVAPETATLGDVNRLSGLQASVNTLGSEMRNAPRLLGGDAPRGFDAGWRRAMAGRFDGPRMMRTIEARVAGRISQADLTSLAEFYNSPVGRKAVAAEIAAARGNSPSRLAEGLRLHNQVSAREPARLALYRRIVRAVRMEAIVAEFSDAVVDSMIAGMGAAIDDPALRRQFLSTLRQFRAAQRTQLGTALNAGVAYAYRRLTIEDLRAYAEFLESPPARRYYGVVVPAVRSVMASESRALGQALIESAEAGS